MRSDVRVKAVRVRSQGFLLVQDDQVDSVTGQEGRLTGSLEPPRLEDPDSGAVALPFILASDAAHCRDGFVKKGAGSATPKTKP